MKAAQKKLKLLIIELVVVAVLLTTATFAFFEVTRFNKVENMVLTVRTINEILLKRYGEPDSAYSNEIRFVIPEDFIMMTFTTIDGHNFYYEKGIPYTYGQEPGFGYLLEEFVFFSGASVEVYLKDDNVFSTLETDDKATVINALRLSFNPYYFDENENKVFLDSVIYADNVSETIVPDVEEDDVTVYSFTTLKIEGGVPLFTIEPYVETHVMVCVWLEGNDEDAMAKVADAIFSMAITLTAVELEETTSP